MSKNRTVYITDARFPNERQAILDFCRAHGVPCQVVRIKRENTGQVTSGHISDQLSKDLPYDHELVNDGTIEDLRDAFLHIL